MAGEKERVKLQGDSLECVPEMYHGPPPVPLLPVDTSPAIPAIGTLVTAIMKSSDEHFFLSYCVTDPSFPEWCLVHISFQDSIDGTPSHMFERWMVPT